jgi:hypothetical protein
MNEEIEYTFVKGKGWIAGYKWIRIACEEIE